MFKDQLTQQIVDFITSIGVEVSARPIGKTSFLPGIYIDNGLLIIDEEKLLYPGDILHEAGHLAVAPPEIRSRLSDEVELPGFNMDGIEAGAMAWSYAAALYLGLDPAVVFHGNGYKGNAEGLLMNFSVGAYIGVNILVEAGMAHGPGNPADGTGYPQMIKWLRE